ncbi:MAG: hypothetical protein K6C94_07485 [Candidatus Gastranaerophilales bacterium]|nr:hypothetical protein [Candidatus Gastranaerophilales bacterium]
MNISFLKGISAVSAPKIQNNHTQIKTKDMPSDTFVRTSSAVKESVCEENFNPETAAEELRQIKNFKGVPKFDEEKIATLVGLVSEQPEKWQAVKTIVQEPKMISTLVMDFASRDAETLNAVADLTVLKKENGEPRFTPLNIKNMANQLEGHQLAKIGVLSQMPIDSDEIIAIAKNDKITDTAKVVQKVNKFAKENPDARRISFVQDEFDENAYNVRIDLPDNGSKILLLDKNLEERAIEEVKIEKSKEGYPQQVKYTTDYKNNTTSKVVSMKSPSLPQPIVTEETRVVRNAQGQVLRTEQYGLSDLAGTPNIKYVYPDGTEKIISEGKYDENTGETTVFKDMVSTDGTRTQYQYAEDADGNVHSSYKITDKSGKVLLDKNITFEVVDENTCISTEKDKKYEIKFAENSINVTNMNTGEVSVLELDGKIDGNKEKLMKSFRHMPAEEIIALGQTTDNFNGIENTNESTYSAVTRTIKSGDNLFVVLHEAGHAKDYANVDVKQKETLLNSIFSNPEVNKVFEEEKAAFNKAFPLAQRDHISYFIKTSEYKDGIQEAIAETNAILNTKNSEELFEIRSHYLQQYFPKTIAYLATIMD